MTPQTSGAVPRLREARAFAPATLSNLGTGFDVLGLALASPGDTVLARLVPGTGVRVVRIEGDGGALPTDALRNTAGIAAAATPTTWLRHCTGA